MEIQMRGHGGLRTEAALWSGSGLGFFHGLLVEILISNAALFIAFERGLDHGDSDLIHRPYCKVVNPFRVGPAWSKQATGSVPQKESRLFLTLRFLPP